jgi:hypothetical protein
VTETAAPPANGNGSKLMGVSVDAWSAFIRNVGVPAAIAIGAVVFMGYLLQGTAHRTEAALISHVEASGDVGRKLDALIEFNRLMLNQQTQQCVNDAGENRPARAACFATALGQPPR